MEDFLVFHRIENNCIQSLMSEVILAQQKVLCDAKCFFVNLKKYIYFAKKCASQLSINAQERKYL